MLILTTIYGILKPFLPQIMLLVGAGLALLGYGHKKKQEGRAEVVNEINTSAKQTGDWIEQNKKHNETLSESELDSALLVPSSVQSSNTHNGEPL